MGCRYRWVTENAKGNIFDTEEETIKNALKINGKNLKSVLIEKISDVNDSDLDSRLDCDIDDFCDNILEEIAFAYELTCDKWRKNLKKRVLKTVKSWLTFSVKEPNLKKIVTATYLNINNSWYEVLNTVDDKGDLSKNIKPLKEINA